MGGVLAVEHGTKREEAEVRRTAAAETDAGGEGFGKERRGVGRGARWWAGHSGLDSASREELAGSGCAVGIGSVLVAGLSPRGTLGRVGGAARSAATRPWRTSERRPEVRDDPDGWVPVGREKEEEAAGPSWK